MFSWTQSPDFIHHHGIHDKSEDPLLFKKLIADKTSFQFLLRMYYIHSKVGGIRCHLSGCCRNMCPGVARIITLMMSHINSYNRKKLNNQSAHQLFSFINGGDILDKLGIKFIPANEINLTPLLLKNKKT